MKSLYNLVGMGHHPNALTVIQQLGDDAEIELHREPENPYDPNAIVAVHADQQGNEITLGHIKRAHAAVLAKEMDAAGKTEIEAKIVRNHGSYVEVEVEDPKMENVNDKA